MKSVVINHLSKSIRSKESKVSSIDHLKDLEFNLDNNNYHGRIFKQRDVHIIGIHVKVPSIPYDRKVLPGLNF